MAGRIETYPSRCRARVFLWMLFLSTTALTGCKDKVRKGLTGVRLIVPASRPAVIDQIRVSASYTTDATPPFDPTFFPAFPGRPLSGDLTLTIILPDEDAGKTLSLRVDGLHQRQIVASGLEDVVLVQGELVDVEVPLGTAAVCGDNIIREGIETCDDGNDMPNDGCSALCVEEHGYYCGGSPYTCVTVCGDGMIAGTEACDDNNSAEDDGCSKFCVIESGFMCFGEPSVCTATCGDGRKRGTEECDDGNLLDGDGCSTQCTIEPGYACYGEPSSCSGDCGDGLIRGSEQCDDQNVNPGDGCSNFCMEEEGWDCANEPSQCLPICGDGLIRGGEECDDGNQSASDGCAGLCTVEPGYTCRNEPSECLLDCSVHGQCPFICNETDGTCVDEADIVFVRCAPSCPGADGTFANPYCTAIDGLNAAGTGGGFVYFRQSICEEQLNVTWSDITIVAEPGTILRSTSCPTVQIWGANVTIDGLSVTGIGSGNNYTGGGIIVDNGGQLSLLRVGQIGPSGCYGVLCDGSICGIHGNLIIGNSGGGVDVHGAEYSLTNNVVVRNGTNTTIWGGVRLDVTGVPIAEFINNTVADNLTTGAPGSAGGVYCASPASVTNSIMWNNGGDEVSPMCSVAHSAISQTGFEGNNGNIEQPPEFANPGMDDYHLQLSSPCIDAADPAGVPPAPAVDIDGDSRPAGNGVDMGADEAG